MAKKRKLGNQPGRTHSDHARPKKPSGHPPPSKPKHQQKKKQHKQAQHEEPAIPFEPHDRILLLGEGDLSFAASLVTHHGCTSVTATVLEKNLEELTAKYPHVGGNIEAFSAEDPKEGDASLAKDGGGPGRGEEDSDSGGWSDEDDEEDDDQKKKKNTPPPKRNNRIAYGIDATKPLPNTLTRPPYATIIFNFPHVGGLSTDVNRQVRHNQSLLVSFFTAFSAPRALAPGGSIVVTLFEAEPYTLWNVKDLARHAGLQVERSFRFQASAYPGYRHARTCGVIGGGESGWRGEERRSRSYVFRRKGEVPQVRGKKRKKGDESSDDESD